MCSPTLDVNVLHDIIHVGCYVGPQILLSTQYAKIWITLLDNLQNQFDHSLCTTFETIQCYRRIYQTNPFVNTFVGQTVVVKDLVSTPWMHHRRTTTDIHIIWFWYKRINRISSCFSLVNSEVCHTDIIWQWCTREVFGNRRKLMSLFGMMGNTDITWKVLHREMLWFLP